MTALTAEQVNIIRDTWRSIGPISNMVPQIFYDRLFEIDPSTKPLFTKTNMPGQHVKLMEALELVAENANDLDSLTPALEDLGRRHVRYGVEDKHYDSVGAALMWTLERGFGAAFTHEVRQAWLLAYQFVSGTMRQAAAGPMAMSA